MSANTYTVCLIDPDESVHDAVTALVSAAGANINCFTSAEAFLEFASANGDVTDCLLMEASLPGMGTVALVKTLRSQGNTVPIIVLASISDLDIAEHFLDTRALEVIGKPHVGERLMTLLLPVLAETEQAAAR